MKILSAERSIEPVSTATTPDVPSTVTLLVTQDQALAISAAVTAGKITFALRSNNDEQRWLRASFKKDELGGKPKTQVKPKVKGYVNMGKKGKFTLFDGKWIKNEGGTESFVVSTPSPSEKAEAKKAEVSEEEDAKDNS